MTAISVEAQVPPDRRLLLTLPEEFPAGPVKVTVQSVEPATRPAATAISILGQQLRTLRQQALDEGMQVLTQDEVLAEVRRRSGEPVDGA